MRMFFRGQEIYVLKAANVVSYAAEDILCGAQSDTFLCEKTEIRSVDDWAQVEGDEQD